MYRIFLIRKIGSSLKTSFNNILLSCSYIWREIKINQNDEIILSVVKYTYIRLPYNSILVMKNLISSEQNLRKLHKFWTPFIL